MDKPSSEEISGMLLRWGQGDAHALDSVIPLVKPDLHRLAIHLLRGERPGHTLQPTALVNEAYLKLARGQRERLWENPKHFFAVAACVMRHILVDYARRRSRGKRNMNAPHIPLDEAEGFVFIPERSADFLALDEALDRLYALQPRQAIMVVLRFYVGMTDPEIAEILQVHVNTVARDWDKAKDWLAREMGSQSGKAAGFGE
jgi:RNA polymerase sigma factor (TIGR02999 family)